MCSWGLLLLSFVNLSLSIVLILSGVLRHSVGVFQLIFGTQYFSLFESLDESMFKNTSLTEKYSM